LIIINKHELVSERELDIVIDKINTLNTDTPKVLHSKILELDLFFGIETNLFGTEPKLTDHHSGEVDVLDIKGGTLTDLELFEALLKTLDKTEVYRVKGVLPVKDKYLIINWAFGRHEWHGTEYNGVLKLTVMGIGLFRWKPKFLALFQHAHTSYSPRHIGS
jgi:G3E family GTPase